MAIVDSPERFEIGRVVSRTFSVLTRNAVVFLALSALLMIPMLLSSLYFSQALRDLVVPGARVAATSSLVSLRTIFAPLLVQIVCTYVLQAAVVQGAISDLNGTRAKFGDSLAVAFRTLLPVVAIAILSYLGMMLGFVLLLIPGIIVAMAWMVVVPVKVVEQTGISESFGRSRALTKGYRWKLFALVLLYFVAALIIQMVIGVFFGVSILKASAANFATPVLITNWIETLVYASLTAVGVTSIYYELRLVKEGAGPSQLAAAFD